MITPMIVAFRECLEMLLIIVPLLVYVTKMNRADLSKYIYGGSIFGIVVSVLTGAFLIGQVNDMSGYPQQLFLGSLMIFLAVLILYSIVWVNKTQKSINYDIAEKYDVKLKGISLFLLSFITIFRESIEIIIFILPSSNNHILNLTLGIILGILISLILAIVIFKTSKKLNVNVIFTIINVILILIGGDFFGEGLAMIFPNIGESIQLAGQLIFTIPLLYLFLKRTLKKYMKKNK